MFLDKVWLNMLSEQPAITSTYTDKWQVVFESLIKRCVYEGLKLSLRSCSFVTHLTRSSSGSFASDADLSASSSTD